MMGTQMVQYKDGSRNIVQLRSYSTLEKNSTSSNIKNVSMDQFEANQKIIERAQRLIAENKVFSEQKMASDEKKLEQFNE